MATVRDAKRLIELTYEEKRDFKRAYEELWNLRVQLDTVGVKNLINPMTGEVITSEDFARVLGVIDGLAYTDLWEEE